MRYEKLEDLLEYEQPNKYIVANTEYDNNYDIPVLTAGSAFILGYTKETNNIYKAENNPVIIFDDFTTASKYVDFNFKVKSSAMKILKPRNGNNIKYIYYAMQMIKFDNQLHKRYWISQYSKIKIPIPSLDKQKNIVDILDKIQEVIDIRKKQIEELDVLIKARFVELFGDPMTNSKGHILKKYGDLFELNAGGTPSKQKPEYWDNGTISWIGSNMCQNTVVYTNDGIYITEEGLKHSSAKIFPIDSVLIALVGATIGKTALLKFETTTNQNVLGVRGIRESGYTPEFIFYYTQGLYQKFLNIGDGGFAMASKGFISELPVPVVDLALQEQFSAFVEQTDKSKLELQKSLEEMQNLFDSLMAEYFG